MLSNNQIKLVRSLRQKKYRIEHGLFIAEGMKLVNELIQSDFELENLFCTEDYERVSENSKCQHVTEKELSRISNLSTPNKVLGLFKIPENRTIPGEGLIVVLDGINDPGNLGTIIRLCDWFGVAHLVCSSNTVDCYNPKVVQATMGSLARIPISYTDLESYLNATATPVFGAVMDGENLYKTTLSQNAILVLGSEANGISEPIEHLLTHRLTIPRYDSSVLTESLNVATATAILLNEFRREATTQK